MGQRQQTAASLLCLVMFMRSLSAALVLFATIRSAYGQNWLEPCSPSPRMLTFQQVLSPRSEGQRVPVDKL